MQKEYLTKEKHKELTEELEYAKITKRKEIADKLEYAKSLGDLSENAEYAESRDAQAALEDRIAQIESVLATAEIIKIHHSDTVEVGSKVKVKKQGEKEIRSYSIVGSEESNVSEGKISFRSPFGQSILGKKKNDDFSYKTVAGEHHFNIIEIE